MMSFYLVLVAYWASQVAADPTAVYPGNEAPLEVRQAWMGTHCIEPGGRQMRPLNETPSLYVDNAGVTQVYTPHTVLVGGIYQCGHDTRVTDGRLITELPPSRDPRLERIARLPEYTPDLGVVYGGHPGDAQKYKCTTCTPIIRENQP